MSDFGRQLGGAMILADRHFWNFPLHSPESSARYAVGLMDTRAMQRLLGDITTWESTHSGINGHTCTVQQYAVNFVAARLLESTSTQREAVLRRLLDKLGRATLCELEQLAEALGC